MNKASAAVCWVWVLASGVGAWAAGNNPRVSGVQSADMDSSVRPQDDLFQYANGTWLRTVPIPQDRSRYGVDVLMTEQSFLYASFMNEAAFAQSWKSKQRVDATIAQFKSNEHSPEKFRANGSVVHMPSFYAVFGVKPGDKMYVAPESRVTLW